MNKNNSETGKIDRGDAGVRGSVFWPCAEDRKMRKSRRRRQRRRQGRQPFIGTPDKIKWVQYSPGVEFGRGVRKLRQGWSAVRISIAICGWGKISGALASGGRECHGDCLETFMAGMGDSYDESKMMSLAAGSYVFMPRRMHHFAGAKGGAVVQVHGVGPFKINYVNPADDPSKATKSAK